MHDLLIYMQIFVIVFHTIIEEYLSLLVFHNVILKMLQKGTKSKKRGYVSI